MCPTPFFSSCCRFLLRFSSMEMVVEEAKEHKVPVRKSRIPADFLPLWEDCHSLSLIVRTYDEHPCHPHCQPPPSYSPSIYTDLKWPPTSHPSCYYSLLSYFIGKQSFALRRGMGLFFTVSLQSWIYVPINIMTQHKIFFIISMIAG